MAIIYRVYSGRGNCWLLFGSAHVTRHDGSSASPRSTLVQTRLMPSRLASVILTPDSRSFGMLALDHDCYFASLLSWDCHIASPAVTATDTDMLVQDMCTVSLVWIMAIRQSEGNGYQGRVEHARPGKLRTNMFSIHKQQAGVIPQSTYACQNRESALIRCKYPCQTI